MVQVRWGPAVWVDSHWLWWRHNRGGCRLQIVYSLIIWVTPAYHWCKQGRAGGPGMYLGAPLNEHLTDLSVIHPAPPLVYGFQGRFLSNCWSGSENHRNPVCREVWNKPLYQTPSQNRAGWYLLDFPWTDMMLSPVLWLQAGSHKIFCESHVDCPSRCHACRSVP